MKKLSLLPTIIIMLSMTGCEVVGGIFKTGVGVGVFLVVAVIAIIIFAISKAGGK